MSIIHNNVAVVIPALNEEKVLGATLESVLKIVNSHNIFVVDDGSEDNTSYIANKYTKNVANTVQLGKAEALNFAIDYFSLADNFDYIFFLDADTQPSLDFLDKAIIHFQNDTSDKVVCVVGRVKGYGVNWISKYRQWEYQISHMVHKKAQHHLKSIIVVPGCSTVYKSQIFNKLKFPTGTLTEDMDFTFTLHRMGYHNMVFEEKAVVYTQDPQNMKDYTKQLSRWYTGFWQNVKKHNIPWQGQMLDLEASILATEGLFNSLLVLVVLLSFIPLVYLDHLSAFRIPLLIDFFAFFLPTLIWSIITDKDIKRIFLIPHFYFLRFYSSILFLKAFINGFATVEKTYVWDTRRYNIASKGV